MKLTGRLRHNISYPLINIFSEFTMDSRYSGQHEGKYDTKINLKQNLIGWGFNFWVRPLKKLRTIIFVHKKMKVFHPVPFFFFILKQVASHYKNDGRNSFSNILFLFIFLTRPPKVHHYPRALVPRDQNSWFWKSVQKVFLSPLMVSFGIFARIFGYFLAKKSCNSKLYIPYYLRYFYSQHFFRNIITHNIFNKFQLNCDWILIINYYLFKNIT